MNKVSAGFLAVIVCNSAVAAKTIDLYQAPLSSLNQFNTGQKITKTSRTVFSSSAQDNLKQISQTQKDSKTITRYQQLYQGIPVIGAQVMITKGMNQGLNSSVGEVNGQLMEDIQLNTKPAFDAQKALQLAKTNYFNTYPQAATQEESIELQIRPGQNNELSLVYLVSFKSLKEDSKPVWPFFVIDAQTGEITKQWNNIKTYLDGGPGGNEKVHEYWYGKDGVPSLDVTQKNGLCVMESSSVKLVNLKEAWDWEDRMSTPFQYTCDNNTEENVNGGFSPSNDAYYFGHTIVTMYKDWYGMNALQDSNGKPMQLVMRVHFGHSYDNAFWDGRTMSFGDGSEFYPLVSLDVAGHEVTHGFTEQHSGLEYHDQPGALNESLSDMAGQTARAYLLDTMPVFYGKAYLNPNEVTWGIGETITRDSFGKALRFMDYPSSDGFSADCLDKKLAQSTGSYCGISYSELVNFAKRNIPDPNQRQSYIVHTASGVFNKAFYLLSKKIGIKSAYQIMILANTKYWTPTTDFKTGACGVLRAAKESSVDLNDIKAVFDQVGVSTVGCSV